MMLSGLVVVARGHPGSPLGTHLIDLNFNHDDSSKYFNMLENFWCVRVDIELLPLDTLPQLDSFNEQCPYLEKICTLKPAFVYISDDENVGYPEDDVADAETDDMADSEDSSESNYNLDSCEVVQEDDIAGSDSETVPAATVDGEDCNEDKSRDDSADEQQYNVASFN
ncbi:hypothetical protein ACOSQ3_012523 [Xanthoceras sorbifolium]